MAITITLVDSTANRLRYLAVNSGSPLGGSASIPNDAGATPDLATDLATDPSGEMRPLVLARTLGIGPIAAGTALTQAQARAILNSDDPTGAVLTNNNVPRAVITSTPRSGTATWTADANVDGGGDPIVDITSSAAAGSCYIDIHARHSYDL